MGVRLGGFVVMFLCARVVVCTVFWDCVIVWLCCCLVVWYCYVPGWFVCGIVALLLLDCVICVIACLCACAVIWRCDHVFVCVYFFSVCFSGCL